MRYPLRRVLLSAALTLVSAQVIFANPTDQQFPNITAKRLVLGSSEGNLLLEAPLGSATFGGVQELEFVGDTIVLSADVVLSEVGGAQNASLFAGSDTSTVAVSPGVTVDAGRGTVKIETDTDLFLTDVVLSGGNLSVSVNGLFQHSHRFDFLERADARAQDTAMIRGENSVEIVADAVIIDLPVEVPSGTITIRPFTAGLDTLVAFDGPTFEPQSSRPLATSGNGALILDPERDLPNLSARDIVLGYLDGDFVLEAPLYSYSFGSGVTHV